MDELDEVADEAHDRETNRDRLRDLDELCSQRSDIAEAAKSPCSVQTFVRRLGTPSEELESASQEPFRSLQLENTHLVTLANELLGNVDELLELVGHGGLWNESR